MSDKNSVSSPSATHQPSPARPARRKPHGPARRKPSRLERDGWIPNQHGAWAMLLLPYFFGLGLTLDAATGWTPVPLAVAWLIGYFTFFAASLWAKSKGARRRTFARPVLAYGTITLLAVAATLALSPHLIWWAAGYAPLVGIALYETSQHRARSLLSGGTTVAASSLLVPVFFSIPGWSHVAHPLPWVIAGLSFLYFFSTILYVKTLIRERGKRSWLLASLLTHAAAMLLAAVAAATGWTSWFFVVVFAALTARAWYMPWSGARRDKPWTPKQVGQYEIVGIISLLIAVFLSN